MLKTESLIVVGKSETVKIVDENMRTKTKDIKLGDHSQ